jgi:amino acid adenylation domain-containing protein/thioester reductase-like protein
MYKIRLSPYAKIFYTEWLLDPDSSRYNVSYAQILHGKLDANRLKKALIRYVNDHLLLNSHIQEINGEPYWVKNTDISELEYFDYPISYVELLKYVTNKFDLYNGHLYRFKLVCIDEDVYKFIVVFHHILLDGISSDFGVFESISDYYKDINYTNKYSIEDQIKLLTNLTDTLFAKLKQNKDEHEEFWRQQLSDIKSINLNFLKLERSFKRENTAELSYNPIEEIRFSYENEVLFKLNQIKHKYSITSYIYGQCVFALLLHRYTRKEALIIAYPIAIKEGRNFIYGAQLNTNFMPYRFSYKTTIIELFKQSRDFFHLINKKDIKYSYYPITDLFSALDIEHDLLNIFFVQTSFKNKLFEFEGINKAENPFELNVDSVSKKMLLFEQEFGLRNDRLNYRVRYDKRNLDRELVNNFVTNYNRLFLEILDDLLSGNGDKPISSYSLLDAEQYRKIVYEFNQVNKDYLQNKTIHQLFEEQVLKTPNNIAVVYENTEITYQELNRRANQLAHYLLDKYEIKPDDLIVLCLDRSELMLIGILAILKSGAAYVPIDPNYPDERIKYILVDTKANIVLTKKTHVKRLQLISQSTKNVDIIAIDVANLQVKLAKQNTNNPIILVTCNNLIYVIYTSGTTGNPKGVMQQHNNVMRLFTATDDWYHFTDKDVWTLFHSYAFDFSVWEIWGALLYGGKLIIPTVEQCMDTYMFYELCVHKEVTVLNQTPQAFYQFITVAIKKGNEIKLSSLRYVIFGGEALNFVNLIPWFDLYGYSQPKLINMYGITETTVHVTYKEITEKDIGQSSNIGMVIPDQKIFILDDNLAPLPIGAIGELYVGGEGLAREYLNQPELTAKKFIPNPFQTEEEKLKSKNKRLYKTGDLARRFLDGSLEYIGRNDSQVKIRGYRIELGEIENALLAYPDIKQVAVLIKEEKTDSSQYANDKYMVVYYVAQRKLDEVRIYNYLAGCLPEYMLPNMVIYLNKLPLNINGKIDKAVLPEPKFEIDDRYVEPKTEQEKLICQAFTKALRIEKIGINDDFFKLGGNSLKAITLTSILQVNFDVKVAHIFNLRTPLKLAENLHASKDVIKQKLELVKSAHKNKLDRKQLIIDTQLQDKISRYLESIDNLPIDYFLHKPIVNVLLTGSTGFLGCNLLNQLLKLTNYKIFLLIRAASQTEAINRINRKFQYYFDKTLEDVYGSRVFVFKADIEKSNLGLSLKKYQELVDKIDSVIHAAALVKHYGEYDVFYSANVQATINLLELTQLTKLKDFHYVSTCSVLNHGFIPNCDEHIYIEDDMPLEAQEYNNVYAQTKLQGEQQTIEYRRYGINSNVYRVGNLAFMAENCHTQENIEDNAFFNWLKCLFKLKGITKDLISLIEISPVDLVAQAIVKIFDKTQLNNSIYHLSNPYLLDLSTILLDEEMLKLEILSINQLIDRIVDHLNNNTYNELILKFLLYQGWLDGWNIKHTTAIKIMQNKTIHILKHLGFEWLPVTNEMFGKYLESLKKVGQ